MGTPLPPVNDGDPCAVCWGAGKDFGDIPTPDVIKLALTSLLPGEFEDEADPANLLATHWLEQTGLPCVFNIIDGILSWTVAWNALNTTISVTNIGTLRSAFIANVAPICQVDLPNDLVVPAGNIAYNGFANITFV